MAAWVRNLFLLTVLFVWASAVAVSLAVGTLPDPLVWSVPTTVWLAVNPPVPKSWKVDSSTTSSKATDEK